MGKIGSQIAMAVAALGLVGAGYGAALLRAPQASDPGASGPPRTASAGPAGQAAGARRQRPPANVFAQTVTTRSFAARTEAIGTLEPRESVPLSVNAADRVTRVYFEDGQRVRAGQTLLVLAQREQAAAIESAEAQLAEARSNLERRERLFAESAISAASLEQARRDAETAAASLRTVQSRQKDRILVAPFDGVLGFRQVSEGAYVRPGEPVATLIDDAEMRLEFAVPSHLLADVGVGTLVRATSDDLPGMNFEGAVTSLDNAIDPVTRSFKVRASLPNPERIMRPGLFMKVDLLARPRESLAVPEGALEAEGPRSFVYVIADREGTLVAERREVALGTRSEGYAEVLAGLTEGDRIVTDGLIQVRAGAPVIVRDAGVLDPAIASARGAGSSPQAIGSGG